MTFQAAIASRRGVGAQRPDRQVAHDPHRRPVRRRPHATVAGANRHARAGGPELRPLARAGERVTKESRLEYVTTTYTNGYAILFGLADEAQAAACKAGSFYSLRVAPQFPREWPQARLEIHLPNGSHLDGRQVIAGGKIASTRFTWTVLSETGFRVSERRDHVGLRFLVD